jgi:hypothetical protein
MTVGLTSSRTTLMRAIGVSLAMVYVSGSCFAS